MFSKTTVESSTRIPTTSVIPSSEIVSSVMFISFMTASATQSDAGIAIRTTIALRHDPRKNSITTPVSAIPSSRVLMTPEICCWVNFDWTFTTPKVMSGNCARMRGSAAITLFEASTSDAAEVFWIDRDTPLTPLTNPFSCRGM